MAGFDEACDTALRAPAEADSGATREAATPALAVSVRRVDALAPHEREAMWALYARCYAGSSRALFASDLDGKQSALLLHDAAGALCGFSTMAWWDRTFEGERARILFSGDTIIDPAHWGSQALAFNWLRHAGTLKADAPDTALYWFLIVKGQRTYRYLSAFARRFVPHWDRDAPPAWHRLLDALARERFGAAYDPATGVVRFDAPQGHLSPALAHVSERERARADVAFFLQRNPGYARGDELACLCELSRDNLRPLAQRVFCAGAGA